VISMSPVLKYALIGGGVIVGGFVLYRIVDMAVSPSSPATGGGLPDVSPNPAVQREQYGRQGESDVTAIGRIFERAIDRIGEGYVTYTREVSQTNRERDRTRGAANDDAARQAKLRAGARS